MNRKKAKKWIKGKMLKHGISISEMRKELNRENETAEKEKPQPPQPQKQPKQPRRRQSVKNPRANSETKITTGGFISNQPIVGNRPVLNGMKKGIFNKRR